MIVVLNRTPPLFDWELQCVLMSGHKKRMQPSHNLVFFSSAQEFLSQVSGFMFTQSKLLPEISCVLSWGHFFYGWRRSKCIIEHAFDNVNYIEGYNITFAVAWTRAMEPPTHIATAFKIRAEIFFVHN